MAYRRTDKMNRRLAERRAAIVSAARDLAAARGLGSVQMLPVAARAGIAAGTVYRYFPSKTELVTALIDDVAAGDMRAMRTAAEVAPGPLSALAAGVIMLATSIAARRRMVWAMLTDPVEGEAFHDRYRRAVTGEIARRIEGAIAGGFLPAQDAHLSALALTGALIEGLVGTLTPSMSEDTRVHGERVRALALFALRAVGVPDARARGIVVQTALPVRSDGLA